MSIPVTRSELSQELGQLEERIDRKLDALEERIDRKLDALETRFEEKLEIWGGALLARIESGEQRMIAELARHARAIQESVAMQIAVIDEKYADLPARVNRLEAAVFPDEPR